MHKRIWLKIVLIVFLALVTGLIALPQSKKAQMWGESPSGFLSWIHRQEINLGLDLQGGTQLRYRIDMSQVDWSDRDAIVEGIINVMERRVNTLGVAEPIIQSSKINDQYFVIVELPGIKDINEAIAAVGKTVQLDFREQKTEYSEAELTEIRAFNDAQKLKAEGILQKVLAGEDFAQLAKEFSEGTNIAEGGLLDFVYQDEVEPTLAEKLFALPAGTVYSELFEDAEGYHIIKVMEKKETERTFQTEEEVSFSYLLISYAEAVNAPAGLTRTIDEAKSQAAAVSEQAKAGADFNSLISANSDLTGNTVLTNVTRGSFSDHFEDPQSYKFYSDIFASDKDSILGPYETNYGQYVIKIADKKASEDKTEIQPQIQLADILTKKKPEVPQGGWVETGLTGKQFKHASVGTDPSSFEFLVNIQFNDEGRDLFAKITERNLDQPIAIYLDNEPIIDTGLPDPLTGEKAAYAPVVRSVISDGRAVISGNLTQKEAHELSTNLNTGAIPAPVILIGQSNVGASLGQKALESGIMAGIIGLIFLAFYMIIYYRLPGLMADLALLIYALLVIALLKLMHVTLTLAGIAGLILSIGMAVDANILIFERIKEELRRGKTLSLAISEGFKRAWSSIRDSNLSSLITCAILFIFGTGIIRGFAVTLAIGILVSMFSAINITRNFLLVFVGTSISKKSTWWGVKAEQVGEELTIDTELTRKERRRLNR